MTNKTTKRAMLSSVVALFLCCAMLMGTTYAWFTDSVTSANNVIKSGNLDIVLEYWDGTKWEDVNGKDDILAGDLWEPGYTDVAYLRIKNNGSLALRYALGVNIVSETAGVNVAGDEFKLSDSIYFDVVDGKQPTFATREEAMGATDSATKISQGYSQSATLAAGSDYVYLAMVVYMPETVGNEANHNGVNVPRIDLGINIFATQVSAEPDSFGTDYDASVSSVDEANALLAAGKDAFLLNCNEPDGILAVPAGYTGLLTIANSTLKSVQAEENVKIVILGNVVVNANGSGVATVAAQTAFDGSAITAKGNLDISGDGTLTAIAANVVGAFGIGGMDTKSITLTGITVELAQGAYAYGVGTDTKYYKDAPEGGAAIGSGFDGAVITLKDVAVINAIGGSKAAGIGARYHVGVTVNIEDSAIAYVEGGVSAAGIGGSRISNGATESGVVINIKNSEVSAKGGAYGAGIGSGYDTHCQASQPLCTINIENSIIKAVGGTYAAGVGTGYHHAALAGEIKNSTVNAESGEKVYKDTYTTAMGIGFGVTDPAREGQQTDSCIIYNDVEIGIPAVADKWDGTADPSWYNDTDTQFTLTTTEQFAGFAKLVNDGNTFAGKTVKLEADLDLYCEDTSENADGDPVTFRPIGDYSQGGVFEGTFDGNGHTISNLYQNGWDLGYEWGRYGSYGLFGIVNNATIKNLTISGSESYIEGGDTSFVAGSATGTCVFENITIKDSVSATYNNGNGGIIGWSGAGNYTFKNITIKEDCVLAGLWGSFDSSIGGIVGQAEPGATYNFENVTVACRIDAYNDCTASYDYYNYRMCGMLIGRLEETTTIDGKNYPDISKYNITCTNVKVIYGDWANYHYCRAAGERAKRVEAGYSYGGVAADYDHDTCTVHHMELIPFDQIFGGDQFGVKGLREYEPGGVTVIYPDNN